MLLFLGAVLVACGGPQQLEQAEREASASGAPPELTRGTEGGGGAPPSNATPAVQLPAIPFGYLQPAACEVRPPVSGRRHAFACVTEKFTPLGRYSREERDAAGRITFEARHGQFEITDAYAYDDAGRLVAHLHTQGTLYRRDDWRYDEDGALLEQRVEQGLTTGGVTSLQRRIPVLDALGRIDYLRHETDGVAEWSERTQYAWDAAGRLAAIHRGGEFYSESWRYHADGAVAAYERANHSAGWSRSEYDPAGRLVATAYETGAGGGWSKRAYDGMNLVEETGEVSSLSHFTWRRVRQHDGDRVVLEWYARDVRQDPSGNPGSGLRHASRYVYSCDGDLLRVEKDENWDGVAEEVTSFLRDGAGNVLTEETRDATGQRTRWTEYGYGCLTP